MKKKALLGVEVFPLLVFVFLSAAKASESAQATPNWSYVRSCAINVTEDLGGGMKRERSYCCEGWRSIMTNSGQLRSCSSYVGEDNATNDTAGLSTLAEWKKVSEEVKDIHERLFVDSSVGSLGAMQKEIDRYENRIQYLEGQVNEFEDTVKEVGRILGEVLGISVLSPNPSEDPCSTATCINHPDAVCLAISKCRRDYPIFMDLNTYSIIDNCETMDGQCLPRAPACDGSLCNGLSCPSLANATCVTDEECCLTLWQTTEGEILQCPDGGVDGDDRRRRSAEREDIKSYC